MLNETLFRMIVVNDLVKILNESKQKCLKTWQQSEQKDHLANDDLIKDLQLLFTLSTIDLVILDKNSNFSTWSKWEYIQAKHTVLITYEWVWMKLGWIRFRIYMKTSPHKKMSF